MSVAVFSSPVFCCNVRRNIVLVKERESLDFPKYEGSSEGEEREKIKITLHTFSKSYY